MKTHPDRGAAQISQDGGDPGEQFQVKNHVDTFPVHPGNIFDDIGQERPQGFFPDRQHVFPGDQVQNIHAGPVLGKDHEKEFGPGIFPLNGFHGRVGQDGAAHLGKFNKQEFF